MAGSREASQHPLRYPFKTRGAVLTIMQISYAILIVNMYMSCSAQLVLPSSFQRQTQTQSLQKIYHEANNHHS